VPTVAALCAEKVTVSSSPLFGVLEQLKADAAQTETMPEARSQCAVRMTSKTTRDSGRVSPARGAPVVNSTPGAVAAAQRRCTP
jgi:hypothetical protein